MEEPAFLKYALFIEKSTLSLGSNPPGIPQAQQPLRPHSAAVRLACLSVERHHSLSKRSQTGRAWPHIGLAPFCSGFHFCHVVCVAKKR